MNTDPTGMCLGAYCTLRCKQPNTSNNAARPNSNPAPKIGYTPTNSHYSAPYSSPDKAAAGFAEETYDASSYARHEFVASIYYELEGGKSSYYYTMPRVGDPHGASPIHVTNMIAYVHTHPNSNIFSPNDIQYGDVFRINGYVIGPDLQLQRYAYTVSTFNFLEYIVPNPLNDIQRNNLRTSLQTSWNNHLLTGCNFGCGNMTWPNG